MEIPGTQGAVEIMVYHFAVVLKDMDLRTTKIMTHPTPIQYIFPILPQSGRSFNYLSYTESRTFYGTYTFSA